MFEIFESLKCLKVQQVSRFQGPVVLTSSPGLAGPAGQGGAGWAGWVAGWLDWGGGCFKHSNFQTFLIDVWHQARPARVG